MRLERPRAKRAYKSALVLSKDEIEKLNHLIECAAVNMANCTVYNKSVLWKFKEELLEIIYYL